MAPDLERSEQLCSALPSAVILALIRIGGFLGLSCESCCVLFADWLGSAVLTGLYR